MNKSEADWKWISAKNLIFENVYISIMLDSIDFSTHGYICIDYIMINRCNYDIRARNKLVKVNNKEEKTNIHQKRYNRKIVSKTYRRFISMFRIDKQGMNSYRIVFEVSKNNTEDIKSDPKDCEGCPFLKQYTNSKNYQKVITRHVWEEYIELANEIRYTEDWKEIYPLRKETIERVYADCKEKHGLRFTRLRVLKKNQHESLIIFGCHNLSKLARVKKRRGIINTTSSSKKKEI